jgi:hypothetical protein
MLFFIKIIFKFKKPLFLYYNQDFSKILFRAVLNNEFVKV